MPKDELARIAATTCNELCQPGPVSDAEGGPPVLVFEERHTSRLGRIEMAMALVRLYHAQHLRDIGLEGYLADEGRLDLSWAASLRARDPVGLESTAVRLLQEGEVNAAEFMGLLYEDFTVHPIEQSRDYGANPERDPQPELLYRIAQQSLTSEQTKEILAIAKEIESLEPSQREVKTREARRIIEDADPWAKNCLQKLEAALPLGEELALLAEIERRVNERGIELSDDDRSDIAAYRRFLEERDHASTTMAAATGDIARHAKEQVIAMIVGSAHTPEVMAQLHKAKLQAIALTPLALTAKAEIGDLSTEQFERKARQQSVYKDEISLLLAKVAKKNSKPVVAQPWLQAKAELYLASDRIVTAVLGGGGPPRTGGGSGGRGVSSGRATAPALPPFDGFDGKWVRIVPESIERKEEDGRAVVVFKAELMGAHGEREEIWGKAAMTKDEHPPAGERERVEKMLRDAFDKVKTEAEARRQGVTEEAGRIRVTSRVVAAFAKTRDDVLAIKLPTI